MIKNITNGYGIHIGNNSFSTPYIDMTRPSAGLVRYNNNNLEVYDGNTWMVMQGSYPQIELSSEVQAILGWAYMKMKEESRIQDLARKHTAVADALASVAQAEEQVRVVTALVETE
jgi:hypothetical protein